MKIVFTSLLLLFFSSSNVRYKQQPIYFIKNNIEVKRPTPEQVLQMEINRLNIKISELKNEIKSIE